MASPVTLVGLLVALGLSSAAPDFGDAGHRIICQLAYESLSESTRAEVRRLTRLYRRPDGGSYDSFAEACTFADLARRRATEDGVEGWERHERFSTWHYMNVPRDTRRIERRQCAPACVLSGIDYHLARLRDESLEGWKRAEALFYLAHWVGDVHQPLHVSYGDDRGGNDIRDHGLYDRTLHSIWDTGIIEEAGYGSWRAVARVLSRSPPPPGSDDPLDWAQESYDLVTSPEVGYCEWRPAHGGRTCVSLGPSRSFGAAYQDAVQDDVLRRLQLAAVRLAAVLEDAFGE
ncbi:MAG: S1/P1 nuclease [Gemmatimonadota bacterium]